MGNDRGLYFLTKYGPINVSFGAFLLHLQVMSLNFTDVLFLSLYLKIVAKATEFSIVVSWKTLT